MNKNQDKKDMKKDTNFLDVAVGRNLALERFEKMFKEIGVDPSEHSGGVTKDVQPDWIVSGSNSVPVERFI